MLLEFILFMHVWQKVIGLINFCGKKQNLGSSCGERTLYNNKGGASWCFPSNVITRARLF